MDSEKKDKKQHEKLEAGRKPPEAHSRPIPHLTGVEEEAWLSPGPQTTVFTEDLEFSQVACCPFTPTLKTEEGGA